MYKVPEETRVSAWRLFLTAHSLLIEAIEHDLAQADLPPLGWYDVLLALERAPKRRLRMSELSRAIVLSRSNLTRLVDRMESALREPLGRDPRILARRARAVDDDLGRLVGQERRCQLVDPVVGQVQGTR